MMVDDVYDILAAISATADGHSAMNTQHTVSALCHAVANSCYRTSYPLFLSAVGHMSEVV